MRNAWYHLVPELFYFFLYKERAKEIESMFYWRHTDFLTWHVVFMFSPKLIPNLWLGQQGFSVCRVVRICVSSQACDGRWLQWPSRGQSAASRSQCGEAVAWHAHGAQPPSPRFSPSLVSRFIYRLLISGSLSIQIYIFFCFAFVSFSSSRGSCLVFFYWFVYMKGRVIAAIKITCCCNATK